jgi:GT2 family glycosyltransferase
MVSGVVKLLPIAWKSINPKDYTEMIKKVNFPYFVKSHLDLRRFLTKKEYESNELMEVLIGSAGCMLISKEVFRKTKYGIMDMSGKNATTTDDIFFFNQARKNGFDIFCDTGLKCLHYILKKYKKNENGEYVIAHKIETGDAPEDLSKILPESEYIK